jgi:hypothetical protein
MTEHTDATEVAKNPSEPTPAARGPETRDVERIGNKAFGSAIAAGVPLGGTSFDRLQRQIGNRRVGTLLSRAPHQLARQPAPMPTDETKTARALPGLPLGPLRDRFEKETHSRINQAFTAFSGAAKAHAESLKAEAKAEAEIVAATIDIFFGLAAPVFAGRIMTGNTMLKRAADKVAAGLAVEATEAGKVIKTISETDFLKETFKGVGKIGTTAIKMNATALFGESEADVFARTLRDAMHVGVQAMTDKIADLTDEQLVATWATYDVEFTNESAYTEQLKKTFAGWKRLVATIGTHDYEGQSGDEIKAVWMNAYGKRRLAVVAFAWNLNWLGDNTYRLFYGWVPEELQQFVLAKSTKKYGAPQEIDPASIRGHIPNPDTGV